MYLESKYLVKSFHAAVHETMDVLQNSLPKREQTDQTTKTKQKLEKLLNLHRMLNFHLYNFICRSLWNNTFSHYSTTYSPPN